MSRPQTYEHSQLYNAELIVQKYAKTFEERMLFLECFAAYIGGIAVNEYWKEFMINSKGYCVTIDSLEYLKKEISKTGISIAMAISSLIREPVGIEEQKKHGAFYTDYRLAEMMADSLADDIKEDSKVVDFAAGTGILLVGIAEKYKEKYKEKFDKWLQNDLYAYDLSECALRGATVAIMSMTSNLAALKEMVSKWKVCDSLLDQEVEKEKFNIVVGNPPWGKIKLTRHSFALREGSERIYGSDYSHFDYDKYEEERDGLSKYSKDIKERYDLLEKSEPDMYMAFLQKAVKSADFNNGQISFLVPAGLIRSKGTKGIREYLMDNSRRLRFCLFDNKPNFFAIDSRFKFLMVSICNGGKSHIENVEFCICSAENNRIISGETIVFETKKLEEVRPDLTIPEVKSQEERDIFYKVIANGVRWGTTEDIWKAEISREVDMTNDRHKFVTKNQDDCIPVIEGRMVQQHRFGVKSYVSGTGRSAVWSPCAKGGKSQFYISKVDLSEEQLDRSKKVRAGYCDIAGQTNERAMMSAIIPDGVICGNKVPTVIFPNASEDILYLWIGVTNSFVFDWMIRRIISTTVNYFLLLSIPMPKLDINSDEAQKIIEDVKKLSRMGDEYYKQETMQDLRAEIDLLVAQAYGLNFRDIETVLTDFPIMDRKQPAIKGEKKSTITRDTILSVAARNWNIKNSEYVKRYELGKRISANAYIPTEMTILCEGGA